MKGKTQKGITLVALVITIVVLLIIAGVAISTINNTDIIAHANNAANSFNTKQEEENGTLIGYEDLIDKYAGSGNKETVTIKKGIYYGESDSGVRFPFNIDTDSPSSTPQPVTKPDEDIVLDANFKFVLRGNQSTGMFWSVASPGPGYYYHTLTTNGGGLLWTDEIGMDWQSVNIEIIEDQEVSGDFAYWFYYNFSTTQRS